MDTEHQDTGLTKRLYVVLTRSATVLSGLIHVIKDDEYTHAALAFDRNLDYMFSFGRRTPNNPFIGCFKRELLDEGLYARHTNLPGIVIEVPVTAEEYYKAKKIVEEFLLNSHQYNYNYVGLVTGLLGIDSSSQYNFLCSEFVYYVLNQSGVCDFNLPRSLVRPQDLSSIKGRIIFKGNLKDYSRNFPAQSEPISMMSMTV